MAYFVFLSFQHVCQSQECDSYFVIPWLKSHFSLSDLKSILVPNTNWYTAKLQTENWTETAIQTDSGCTLFGYQSKPMKAD